jgi:glycosyltransferase involved in cell wall biosynthesis
LDDRATLLGRVSDQRLPVLYRSCDVFVLPTLALECFGIIILEALASGKPVIATPVAAIPELLSQIFPAGLLPETSASALAQAMSRQIQAGAGGERSPAESLAFRNFVCERYSLARGADRFRALYESGGLAL